MPDRLISGNIEATADEKGCVYVLDWNQKRIQKYDPSGKFLFSIGRRGQGPGEFGNLWTMRFDAKGRIYITDISNKRVTFFDKETGHYQEAIKPGIETGAVILFSNGTYFFSTNTREEKPTGVVWTVPYGIFDRNFKMITEFRRDLMDFQGLPEYSDRARFMAGILSRSAFKPFVITAVTDDERIIVGFPDRYEFDVYDISGKPLFKVRKDGDPLPVTDRHKDFYFETSVLDYLASSGGNRPKDEDVRKAMVYPKFLPAYQRVIPMENGFFFVVTDTLPKASAVDLFDGKGVYAGRFVTDAPAATLAFKGGKAYGVGLIGDYRCVKRYAYTVETY
ncbi:MAG: 6-bladed beta-propeller [Candidatus Aminicenantes bacterium]|nr:6-bladed beta-propeller [Candidatus Aminicenantes bacterium]